MELAAGYRLAHFAEAEEIDEAAVLDFWAREGAMPEATARKRLPEVGFVAIREPGRLAAVSTHYLAWSPQLRTEMWHFRTLVGEEHRRSALALLLLRRTREHLEEQFALGRERRAPGIMFEVENRPLREAMREAVWERPGAPGKRWTFIGENARGEDRRVYYFPGAHAPLLP